MDAVKVFTKDGVELFFDPDIIQWFVASNGTKRSLVGDDFTAALVFLYEDPLKFFSQIEMELLNGGIDTACSRTFPIVDIVKFCLKNNLKYWTNLAVQWLPFATWDEEFRGLVLLKLKEKLFSQRDEVAVRKVLKSNT
jgi:hypothetical protein